MRERQKKALIYVRVSEDPTGRGLSVDRQEAECRQDCQRLGFEVAHVLKDQSISASSYSTHERPAYQQALKLIPHVDVFVTWEASRANRDMGSYVELSNLCRKHNVDWCYSGRVRDLSNPDDRFGAGLDTLLAQRESDYISKRVLAGIRWQIKSGRPHSTIKWGYKRLYNPHTKAYEKTVEDPEVAPIIREMVRRLLAGESKSAVARDLTRRGIPTPNGKTEWRSAHIYNILRPPTYTGLREHHGRIVGPGEWPAIISESDWALLRSRDGTRYAQDSTARHLLTGIAVCGVCGSPVRVKTSASRVLGYTCRRTGCVFRKQDVVDGLAEEAVLQRLEDPRFAEALQADESGQVSEIDDKLNGLRRRLEQTYDEGASGELSSTALVEIEKRLLDQIADLKESRAAVLGPPSVDPSLPGEGARERWAGMTLSARRAVVRAVVTVTINRAAPRYGQLGPNPREVELRFLGD